MKTKYTARPIKAARIEPYRTRVGTYDTDTVMDFFTYKLGWDAECPGIREYAESVADYMNMSADAWNEAGDISPYTLEQWYSDTKMNYPEELEEFEACTPVPVRSSTSINASTRIENMYDVKTELEELISSLSIIEDTYFDIEKTDPRYILKTYLYHVSRHLQAAYNNACEFIERDS